MKEQKTCPFCGRDDLVLNHNEDEAADSTAFWIACETCLMDGPVAYTEDVVYDKWNMRAAAVANAMGGGEDGDH